MSRLVEASQRQYSAGKELNLNSLLPGPENITTGVPLSVAEEFAQRLSSETGLPVLRYVNKKNGINELPWIIEWKVKPLLGNYDSGRFRTTIFVTDQVVSSKVRQFPQSIRGFLTFGEYILVIPYNRTGNILLDIYPHKKIPK